MSASPLGLLLRSTLLAAPLALAWLVPIDQLPPSVAWLVTTGRPAVLAVVGLGALSLLVRSPSGPRFDLWEPADQLLRRLPAGGIAAVLGLALLVTGIYLVPQHRWTATRYAGDEPKYHRMALSLFRDLDANMASQTLEPVTAGRLGHNVRFLLLYTRDAARDLVDGTGKAPEDHVWNLGNWTVAGRQGGRYYVQAPGLPALLFPALLAQDLLAPDRPEGLFLHLMLVLLWVFGAVQSIRLAVEVSGSPLAGIAAGLAIAFAAPVFLMSHHLYPEAGAWAFVPWVMRRVRGQEEPPRPLSLVAAALVIGALPWLHAKYTAVSAVLLLLLLLRIGRRPAALGTAVGLAALPFLLLLLYDHHVTGLFRPDAFYQRYQSDVYPGLGVFFSLRFLKGLSTALFGARDGLLILAPACTAALLATPAALRRAPGPVLQVGLVFAAMWAAAATHEGGAPGPPGRLLVPVAGLLAAPFAAGLVELRPRLSYRWTALVLVAAGLAATVWFLGDWQRTVDPARHAFASAAVDFTSHLPDAPVATAGVETATRHGRDVWKGLLLLLVLGFWALRLAATEGAREPLGELESWRALAKTHAAWWVTLVVLSVGLAALHP